MKTTGIIILFVNIGMSINSNFTNENLTINQKITHSVVDVGISVGTVWVAASISTQIGNAVFPGFGALVGFIVGVGIWTTFEYTELDEYMKYGLDWVVNRADEYINPFKWRIA